MCITLHSNLPWPPTLLLLGCTDIAELLTVDACLAAVERAFRAHVGGQTLAPGILGVPAVGGFDVMAFVFEAGRPAIRGWVGRAMTRSRDSTALPDVAAAGAPYEKAVRPG